MKRIIIATLSITALSAENFIQAALSLAKQRSDSYVVHLQGWVTQQLELCSFSTGDRSQLKTLFCCSNRARRASRIAAAEHQCSIGVSG
jgi:type 1 fimbria pilin